jgi:hypothetical protein
MPPRPRLGPVVDFSLCCPLPAPVPAPVPVPVPAPRRASAQKRRTRKRRTSRLLYPCLVRLLCLRFQARKAPTFARLPCTFDKRGAVCPPAGLVPRTRASASRCTGPRRRRTGTRKICPCCWFARSPCCDSRCAPLPRREQGRIGALWRQSRSRSKSCQWTHG